MCSHENVVHIYIPQSRYILYIKWVFGGQMCSSALTPRECSGLTGFRRFHQHQQPALVHDVEGVPKVVVRRRVVVALSYRGYEGLAVRNSKQFRQIRPIVLIPKQMRVPVLNSRRDKALGKCPTYMRTLSEGRQIRADLTLSLPASILKLSCGIAEQCATIRTKHNTP